MTSWGFEGQEQDEERKNMDKGTLRALLGSRKRHRLRINQVLALQLGRNDFVAGVTHKWPGDATGPDQ